MSQTTNDEPAKQSATRTEPVRDFDIDTAEGDAQDQLKAEYTGSKPAVTERNHGSGSSSTYVHTDAD